MNASEITNPQRVAWATSALAAFVKASEVNLSFEAVFSGDDFRDAITDLVADLLHLANHIGVNPEPILAAAQMHYEAEVWEAQP